MKQENIKKKIGSINEKILKNSRKINELKNELNPIETKKQKLLDKKNKIDSQITKTNEQFEETENEINWKSKRMTRIILTICVIWFFIGFPIGQTIDEDQPGIYFFIGYGILFSYLFFMEVFYYKKKLNKPKIIHKENLKPLVKSLNLVKNELKPIDEKFNKRDDEINSLNRELELDKTNLINYNSLEELKNKYDKDDNLILDIIESTHVDKLLENHQLTIRKIEKSESKSYIPELVKINIFLNDYQKNIENEFKKIQNTVEDLGYQDHINVFKRDIEFYRVLISNLIIMIHHLVNDDLIGYYKIRDMFDKLSIFETNYEKKLISELVGVRNVTKELIDVTYQSQKVISSQLESVDISLSLVSDDIKDVNRILLNK